MWTDCPLYGQNMKLSQHQISCPPPCARQLTGHDLQGPWGWDPIVSSTQSNAGYSLCFSPSEEEVDNTTCDFKRDHKNNQHDSNSTSHRGTVTVPPVVPTTTWKKCMLCFHCVNRDNGSSTQPLSDRASTSDWALSLQLQRNPTSVAYLSWPAQESYGRSYGSQS
jgi:hypothetical protein